MDKVRVGWIGLGARGWGLMKMVIENFPDVEIVGICDLYDHRVEQGKKTVEELRGYTPVTTKDYRTLLERSDIDAIITPSAWEAHAQICVDSMLAGKPVATEVGGAYSIEQCWEMVRTHERTGVNCMMLENCCYDFFELTCLNMAQQGLFGEVIHAQGAYIHNLEPFWNEYQGNWRLDYNQKHAGDVYATHGLGPVCQVLDIHRGDKMEYLVSLSTPSINGLKIAKEKMGADTFANGDMTSTLIKTNKGKTILIQHNVYTPRPYDRLYQLTGTEGFANKYPYQGFTLKEENVPSDVIPDHEDLDSHGFVPNDIRDSLMVAYKHPIAKDIEEKAKQVGGHGGMDFIMDYRLIYCLQNGLPLDQDVYDAAEWSCLGELTAASIENNGLPVKFPDFTRGDWNKVEGYKHAVK